MHAVHSIFFTAVRPERAAVQESDICIAARACLLHSVTLRRPPGILLRHAVRLLGLQRTERRADHQNGQPRACRAQPRQESGQAAQTAKRPGIGFSVHHQQAQARHARQYVRHLRLQACVARKAEVIDLHVQRTGKDGGESHTRMGSAAALVDGRAVDGGRAAYGTGRGRGHRGVRVNAHPYLFHAHVQRKMN